MKKLFTLLAVAILLLSLALFVGCSQTETAGDSEVNTEITKHDCDGGCGMKDMTEDQLTEIDGKYYCAGCAAKVKAEETVDPHAGHDHD
jgi:hypothetical protein